MCQRISPAIEWQNALSVCSRDGVCDASEATVSLASVTVTDFGRVGSGGSVDRTIDHRLSYVIRWDHVICGASGGPPGATRAPTPAAACTLIDLVDANTGAYEMAVSGPGL